jgi:FtsZ-binding cell division protein ZapB
MAEGGDLDFDPIGEGKIDINDFNDDDLQPLLEPTAGEESWRSRFRKYFGRRNVHITDDSKLDAFRKGENESKRAWGNRIRKGVAEEIQMERLDEINEADNKLRNSYPNFDPSKANFFFKIDEYDRVNVRLKNKGAKTYILPDDYSSLPNSIKERLGHSADEIRVYKEIKAHIDGIFPNNELSNTLNDKDGLIEYDLQYNENGEIEITIDNLDNWYFLHNKNGEISKKLPKAIKTALGEEANVIQERNENTILANQDTIAVHERNVVEEMKKKLDEIHQAVSEANRVIERLRVENKQLRERNKNATLANAVRERNENAILANQDTIAVRERNIAAEEEMKKRLDETDQTVSEANRVIERLRVENEQLRERNEVIEEHKPLKQRIKDIFKKYGFTVTAVVTAVGVIIGVIIKSLTSGLATVAKGVGNGLKTIGKKLGQILPGMVGAIASFIFKTAGEVVGFLAKNAWLLIVAVVLYFVEQYKKKR